MACNVVWSQAQVDPDWTGVQMEEVAFVSLMEMGANQVNDIAAWHDQEMGDEYLLVGCDNGLACFRLLPGAIPAYMGKLPTHSINSMWRDVKVVNEHAYVVSEAPLHGMQVFDLKNLRDWQPVQGPVVWEPDTVVMSPSTAHNVVAFEDRSKVILVGSSMMGGGAMIFDVQAPESPTLLGGVSEWGSIHDAQALVYEGPDTTHHGKEVLFAAGGQKLWVFDITDASDVQLISSTTYPDAHFAHQVWVTDAQDHAFLGDELDESLESCPTRTYIVDLTDLDMPFVSEVFESNSMSSDHNQYTHGEWLFQSNYRGGLRMLSDAWPQTPSLTERGFFDPMPELDTPGFQGAWSHVVMEDVGVVAMSSIQQGLWVVRPTFASLDDVSVEDCVVDSLPVSWEMTLVLEPGWDFPVTVSMEGVQLADGQEVGWTIEEAGSHPLAFWATGIEGVEPKMVLTSQQSDWTLNVLTSEANWPARYADEDGDGFGNPFAPVWGCGDTPGTSSIPLDCQDWNANTYPGAPELCDGWSNDCDDQIDEGTSLMLWYLDEDGDGFGSTITPPISSCLPIATRVLDSGDCNDDEATMYPGAPAIEDGLDNNCDGWIQDDELNTCMGDFDLDGVRTITDMLHLLSSFGCSYGCTASLNNLDSVATDDLLLWLGVFGLSCQ